MRVFILEDDKNRIGAFLHAGIGLDLTICKWLEGKHGAFEKFKPPYDLILLDHDLGGMQMLPSDGIEETGYKFCKWFVSLIVPPVDRDTRIIIHSYNAGGANNMHSLLERSGFNRVYIQPYGTTLLKTLETFAKESRKMSATGEKVTISEALGWQKTLNYRHAELVRLRDQNSQRTRQRYNFGTASQQEQVEEPTYDAKALDKRITLLAREIRVVGEAIKRANASVQLQDYLKDESVLGELE